MPMPHAHECMSTSVRILSILLHMYIPHLLTDNFDHGHLLFMQILGKFYPAIRAVGGASGMGQNLLSSSSSSGVAHAEGSLGGVLASYSTGNGSSTTTTSSRYVHSLMSCIIHLALGVTPFSPPPPTHTYIPPTHVSVRNLTTSPSRPTHYPPTSFHTHHT
jgi:hypothetical protein